MKRETVQTASGKFIKSVRWAEGSGMRAKSVMTTSNEMDAARFLPAHAAALRAQFSPEAVRRAEEAQRRATAAVAELFSNAMDQVSKDMGRDVRAILAPLLK